MFESQERSLIALLRVLLFRLPSSAPAFRGLYAEFAGGEKCARDSREGRVQKAAKSTTEK